MANAVALLFASLIFIDPIIRFVWLFFKGKSWVPLGEYPILYQHIPPRYIYIYTYGLYNGCIGQ